MRPLLRVILLFSYLLITLAAAAQRKKDYTQFVNPFIGTGGHGHTYPGAVVPFGMVQLSPDTRLPGGEASSGYNYADTVVYGFSHTYLSSAGNYAILFMPTTGEPKLKNTQYASGFIKKNEMASPGYYKTKLDKYDIGVELTSTIHVGVHRYNYPNTKQANIIIDMQHPDMVPDSWIEVVNDHEIKGFRHSKSLIDDRSVYFYAKFSKPFKTYGTALNDQLQTGQNKLQGKNIKMYIQFDNPGEVIAKVGISSVSAEGALKNMDAEVPGFDFKKVEKDAKVLWNTELSKIEVEGGGPNAAAQQEPVPRDIATGYNTQTGYNKIPKVKKKEPVIDYAKSKLVTFYTALYHTMLAPNIYSDVDGQYRGVDQKIHKAEGFNYYAVFSLRNTYRAKNQLLSIIDRKRTLDFIKSFLAMYQQGGLPTASSVASKDSFGTIGNYSIPMIVDAYAQGIRDFDGEEAFTAMKAVANSNQSGLISYRKNGVILADDEPESVAKTLEYAYDDWCIARMAKMLNKPQDYSEFIQRAQYWKNSYNSPNGFMQARANGGWATPFDPTEVNRNYAGGNAWQHSFSVPQDIESLIACMGGKSAFEAKLDELFTTDSKNNQAKTDDVGRWIGQYAHGNYVGHHSAYLYNFADSPDKTQLYVNRILREGYSDKPDGLAGDDDCGQLSAWYVMSSLGFYNIAPGQLQYQVGIPQFEKAVINLENGKKFTVLNSGAGVSRSNIYLQGMNLNKKTYNKLYLDYTDIADGGEFEVFTGRLPNRLFVQDLEKPTSKITDNLIVPNPYIIAPAKEFKQPVNIEIKCMDPAAKIYYTLDGSVPTVNSALYSAPVTISSTTTVKAIAVKDRKMSFVDTGVFTKK